MQVVCVWVMLLATLSGAAATPPADRIAALRRGVNITGWFRFPASRDPAALRTWMADGAMQDLRTAGFSFVRLAVDPAIVEAPSGQAALLDTIRRWEEARLAVVISPHPAGWHLETVPADRTRLLAFWRRLAPRLRRFDPALTFPEVLNEPVFPHDAAGWRALQHRVLAVLRAALPDSTVILTGNEWGSIAGLQALVPESDPDVVYSFHFYDPVELTSLAGYRPGLDRAALATLPFPTSDPGGCEASGGNTTDGPTRAVIRYYCALHWDSRRVAASIDAAAAWGRQYHRVLLAGEFGASDRLNPPSRLAWLRMVRGGFERDGIGWALWGYDDSMGLAVPRPPSSRPVLPPEVLSALGLL